MISSDGSRLALIDPGASRIIVVGDLHGCLRAYEAAVKTWKKRAGDWLVFLGDYADRGAQGVEILEHLTGLAREDGVICLKGNHEDYTPSGDPLFTPFTLLDEVQQKRGEWGPYFQSTLKPFISGLFLAALWPGKALFLHGGVSQRIASSDDLAHPSREVEEDVLWSDPQEDLGERPNPRGRGIEFGPDITGLIATRLGVRQIMRGHQPFLAGRGPYYSHQGAVATLSGTDVYGGTPFLLEIARRGDHYDCRVRPIDS